MLSLQGRDQNNGQQISEVDSKVCEDLKVCNDQTTHSQPELNQSTLGGLKGGVEGQLSKALCRRRVLVLLQACVTSWRDHIRWEHSHGGHTHIDPDVGLRGAGGRLLAEEQEVAWKELQLRLVRLAVQDNLQMWNQRMLRDCSDRLNDSFLDAAVLLQWTTTFPTRLSCLVYIRHSSLNKPTTTRDLLICMEQGVEVEKMVSRDAQLLAILRKTKPVVLNL